MSIELWRARIGLFSQPVKNKHFVPVLIVRKGTVSLCIRIVLFMMLVAQCVERNPGPNPGPGRGTGFETDGYSGRGGSNASKGKGRGSYASEGRNLRSNSSSVASARNSPVVPHHSEANISFGGGSQPQIDSWFASPNANMGIRSGQEGSISELKGIMLDVQTRMRNMESKFSNFEQSLKDVTDTSNRLLESNKVMNESIVDLNSKVENLEEQLKVSEERCEKLEAQSRRENLRFYGFEDKKDETWEETEEKVRQYIGADLELDPSRISIERAHRIQAKETPRPVIVKFSFFKDKEKVLKQYREKRKQLAAKEAEKQVQGAEGGEGEDVDNASNHSEDTEDELFRKDIHVSEDFPSRVMKSRNDLRPFLRDALKSGKKVFIKYDKLVIEKDTFMYDENTENIKLCSKK